MYVLVFVNVCVISSYQLMNQIYHGYSKQHLLIQIALVVQIAIRDRTLWTPYSKTYYSVHDIMCTYIVIKVIHIQLKMATGFC